MSEQRPDNSIPRIVSELWDMVVSYLKQETLVPMQGLGRFVAFGVVGSFVLAIGVIILMVGCLRGLQTETGDLFSGSWTWLPYFISATVGVAVVGMSAAAVLSSARRRSSGKAA